MLCYLLQTYFYFTNTLREFLHNWHKCPLEFKDELVKGQGHCDLTFVPFL